jgi:hypothetical protein
MRTEGRQWCISLRQTATIARNSTHAATVVRGLTSNITLPSEGLSWGSKRMASSATNSAERQGNDNFCSKGSHIFSFRWISKCSIPVVEMASESVLHCDFVGWWHTRNHCNRGIGKGVEEEWSLGAPLRASVVREEPKEHSAGMDGSPTPSRSVCKRGSVTLGSHSETRV